VNGDLGAVLGGLPRRLATSQAAANYMDHES
jgi:hypothetical protein